MNLIRSERGAWILGGTGVVGAALGWWMAPAQFPYAWLAALSLWLAWPLGSLALIFIHALTGGRWGFAIRRELAAGVATLPLLLPGLLPLLFELHALYPWMRPETALPLDNRWYLNAPFFYARCSVYLLVWLGIGVLVLRTLRREDPEPRLYRMAPPALILLALTITFAAIDFTLSLEPRFSSSIYGMLVISEAVLLALSVAVLGAALGARPGKEIVHDLGRLMFALLVLWAYLDFMQVLIVWNSDLPDEARWYLHRLSGVWAPIAALIAGLHFGLPFFALIWPQLQRSRAALATLAALLVVTEIPRAWWIVIPAAGRNPSLIDGAAMLALIGLGMAIALRAWRRNPAPWMAASHG